MIGILLAMVIAFVCVGLASDWRVTIGLIAVWLLFTLTLGYQVMFPQPCGPDASGCGMARGFTQLLFWACALSLLGSAATAVGWRLAAGPDAGYGARFLALSMAALLVIIAGFLIVSYA